MPQRPGRLDQRARIFPAIAIVCLLHEEVGIQDIALMAAVFARAIAFPPLGVEIRIEVNAQGFFLSIAPYIPHIDVETRCG